MSQNQPEARYVETYTTDLYTFYQSSWQATYTAFLDANLRLSNSSSNSNALTFKVVNEAGVLVYEGACNPGSYVVAPVTGRITGAKYRIYVKTNWSNEANCTFSISK